MTQCVRLGAGEIVALGVNESGNSAAKRGDADIGLGDRSDVFEEPDGKRSYRIARLLRQNSDRTDQKKIDRLGLLDVDLRCQDRTPADSPSFVIDVNPSLRSFRWRRALPLQAQNDPVMNRSQGRRADPSAFLCTCMPCRRHCPVQIHVMVKCV